MKLTAKRFNRIVQRLPVISPITMVWNYHCNWKKNVERLNHEIDLFNKLPEEHRGIDQTHISEASILVIPDFVEEKDRVNDVIIDYRKVWYIEDKILYEYTKELSEKDFIARFNKSLYEHVLQEIKSAKSGSDSIELEEPLKKIAYWFRSEDINISELKPFYSKKNVGGRPAGKSKQTIQKKDEIRKLFVLYKSKDIGDQNKKDAARWIRDSLLKSKPKWWKGAVYKESTIYKVLKTLK